MNIFSHKNEYSTKNLGKCFSEEVNLPLPVEQRGQLSFKENSLDYRGVRFSFDGLPSSCLNFSLAGACNIYSPITDEFSDLWSSLVQGLQEQLLNFDGLKFSLSYATWAYLLKKKLFSHKNKPHTQSSEQDFFSLVQSSINSDGAGDVASREANLVYGGTRSSPFPCFPGNSGNISEPIADNSQEEEYRASWSPSVQAFLDQPPASLPNRLVLGGLLFSLSFAGWAYFGTIDEVGKAQGQLVPEGETYKIEPVEMGQVRSVFVKEGEEVDAGQLLVELDNELAEKEVERLQQTIRNYQTELNQKQSLRANIKRELQIQVAIASAKIQGQQAAILLAEDRINTAKQLLAQEQAEVVNYRLRERKLRPLAGLAEKRIHQLEREKIAHQQRIDKLQPLLEEGAISQDFVFQAEQALRETEQRITSSEMQEVTNAREQLFQAQQAIRDLKVKMIQTQADLSIARQESDRAQAELLAQQSEIYQIELESSQKIQQLDLELTQLQGKISETENLLVTAQAKLKHKYLRAPIDGVVLSLDVQNTGEVLEPGQTVAEIAPEGADLIVSATLPNQEAGFVEVGMPVQVKLDAFPYQDYGVISGEVISISADSEEDERLGEVYRLKIKLEKDHITNNKEIVPFKAGQTVTADIIIRHRRIIDVLLEPIKQIQKDGIDL